MRNREEILQLKAELTADFSFIFECAEKNRRMTERIDKNPAADEFDYAALGYTLHNLYNAFESYFLRIAKFFENNLDNTSWHKELIGRMLLDIEGLRPALFGKDFAVVIDELRRFRHVFRSLYQADLQPSRVISVNEQSAGIADAFLKYHEAYIIFLDKLFKEYGKQSGEW
jgi:hypothetical protein